MSIISLQFIVFTAIVVLVYYLLPKRLQWMWLLVVSYVFYCSAGIQYAGYIVFTTISTFGCGRWLQRLNSDSAGQMREAGSAAERKGIKEQYTRKKRRVLALAIVLNFGILCFVKYADFVIRNINPIFRSFGGKTLDFLNIMLPLGISFYTFQSIGYLVDIYRGKVTADKNIFRYALFVSYFPQIIQGPIGRYKPLAEQMFAPRNFDYEKVKYGAQRAMWGYFKKIVIAERIAVVVDEVFRNYAKNNYYGFTIFVAVFLYSIQIYADFSGGMDAVCGISEMLGIDLAENFRHPFLARSVAEFWQRWHITLGAWMREYLFYPLALSKPFAKMSRSLRKYCGNYVAKILPTCLASFIVFVLIGIWHGSSWKYVAYGLYQATFVSTATLLEPFYARCRAWFRVKPERFSFRLFQILRTILIVTVGRYFSRAFSFMEAIRLGYRTIKVFNPWVFFDGSFFKLGLDRENFELMLLLIVFLFVVDAMQEHGIHLRERIARQGIVFRWLVYLAGIFAIIIFGMYGQGFDVTTFIYQGF